MRRFCAAVAAATVLTFVASGTAHAEGGFTQAPEPPVTQAERSAPQPASMSGKVAAKKRAGDARRGVAKTGASGVVAACLPGDCVPVSATAYLPSTIFGQELTYSCGAAAARNMVYGMTRGAINRAESWFRTESGTTTSGTSGDSIKAMMNREFSSYGAWAFDYPTSGSDLIDTIAADVYYGQTTYIPVKTRGLVGYPTDDLWHWVLGYYYNSGTSSAGYADPNRFNNTAWGRHTVSGSTLYSANQRNNGRVVW